MIQICKNPKNFEVSVSNLPIVGFKCEDPKKFKVSILNVGVKQIMILKVTRR